MLNILVHVLTISLLPLVFAFGLIRGGRSHWEWWTNLSLTLSITCWAFVVGRWDMVGYPLRFIVPLVAVTISLVGWRRYRRLGNRLPTGSIRNLAVLLNLFLTLTFGAQAGFGVAGYFASEQSIELHFPLQNGVYYVGQGGSTVMVNYHAAYAPQAYALDILRLNSLGLRSAGIYPVDLGKYAIFGEPLYSPCEGKVLAARDGLPDYPPPEHDPHRPEGNFVALHCHGVDVYLAHMKEGSVLVSEGDIVAVGQPLGRVGNSGNTSEPHLHIHAERTVQTPDGKEERIGVPIRFNGRFLSRNAVLVAP